ncbi:general substrate transporter [Rhizodiscina lignyota]|uniref:General substrate transporter n=1 Tax=Rhizodiscina lignyota TaxID=1504668 RepID=A0A9P4INP0_9PEZI|nr:general substrate transporter [Rhizodiscina lignyota]
MRKLSNIYAITSIVVIGGLLQGFDISSLSAIISTKPFKTHYGSPDSTTQGGITASISGGSFIGCLAAFALMDYLGRRLLLQIGDVIFIIGAILCAASVDIAMLIVGRFLCGFGVGIFTSTGPTLLAELTKREIRGRIVSLQQWAITWGALIMYYISYGASFTKNNSTFIIPWAVQIAPALLMFFGLFFVPLSPRWLASKDRWEETLQVLADLHGNGNAESPLVRAEYIEIREAISIDNSRGHVSWSELIQKDNILRVSCGISVHVWTQLSGNNAILYYVVYIFTMAGLTGNIKLVSASIQYVINCAMTLPAILFLDKVGRRPALLFGSVMMMAWLFATAGLLKVYGHYVPDGVDGQAVVKWVVHGPASKAVIACTYLLTATYSCTWAPISWVYPPEIFPTRLRGKAVSIATSANWILGFALNYFTPPAFQQIQWKTFIIFGVFNVVAGLQAFFFFPETKRKTLEDIDEIFASGRPAWRRKLQQEDDRLITLVENIEHGKIDV